MMQAPFLKKTGFSIFFILLSSLSGAQSVEHQRDLARADSLFASQKYTEAFAIYERLVHDDEVFSPQMLLKMAYVKEGVQEYPAALYYLSLYYRYHPTLEVLQRMEKIATEQDYEGYRYGDSAFFRTLYARYRLPVTLGLLFVALLWLGVVAYQKRQQKNVRGAAIGLLVLLVVTAIWNNADPHETQAVVQGKSVYLMKAPSAGSDLLTSLDPGHRLPVLDKTDIWYRVKWGEETAYLRRHQVYVVE